MRRLLLVGAGFVMAALVVTTLALAREIRSTADTIYACTGGVGSPLLLTDSSGTGCANGPVKVNWNNVGPAGPPGAAGPKGDPGASAADDATFKLIRRDYRITEPRAIRVARCPKGTTVISGGYSVIGDAPREAAGGAGHTTQQSFPTSSKNGWAVHITGNAGGDDWTLVVFAVCFGSETGFLPPLPGPGR